MQLYFQMRSWSVDGGILLKTLATTLEFWFAGVSEILMMEGWLEELRRCHSRKASKRTHQGPEQFLYSGFLKVQRDLNNLSHIKNRQKKKKRNTGTSTLAFRAELVKCSTWKSEHRNYETRLEAKVTTFWSKRL